MIAEKQIIADVLHHLITISEIQTLQMQISEAVLAKDYAGASEINKILGEKKQALLSLDTMREYHEILNGTKDTAAVS